MKRLKLILLSVAAFLVLSCASVAENPASPFGDQTALLPDQAVIGGTLANGINWFALKNGEPDNRVYLRLAVKAGSVLEDDDQKGVAHLIEHMAFNGSEHFAKNELIDYFESIGMTFGPEVNAYTAFDETVYMLEIPSDDPAIFQKSLLVLRDWATGLTFDPAELDKERGVVIEEWRLGRGPRGRMQDKQIPFLFKGSKYGSRLPIGDPEIVKTIPRQRVIDFYRTWYRPENMTVMLVGDLDTGTMADAIENSLGDIPVSSGKNAIPRIELPVQKKPAVLVIRDPEASYTTLQILEARPSGGRKTAGEMKRRIAQNMVFSIFNNRLSEKTLEANPLILDAKSGIQRMVKPSRTSYLGLVPSEGNLVPAFKQVLEELLRLQQFGVTESELERERQSVLDSMRQTWLNRDKMHSASRAAEMVQYALYDDTMISIDSRYGLYQDLVPEITREDLLYIIREWLTERGTQLVVNAAETATDVPDEAGLLELWQKWTPEKPLTAYTELNLDRPLFNSEDNSPEPDSIVKEETVSSVGIQRWTLSNGATVLLYPTDFKSNEILFSAFSKGGSSVVNDADFPSLSVAGEFRQMSGLNGFTSVELQKKLSGKTVTLDAWVDESYEGMTGGSSVTDLETLLQLVHLNFTRPEFSDDSFQSLLVQYRTLSATRKNKPDEVFSDMISRLMYGSSIRHASLSDGFIAALDRSKSEARWRERFADAGDFTFVFVGSFDPKVLRNLVETYLAVLPSAGKKEEARNVSVPFPTGIAQDTLKMGIDPKSQVFLSFGGKAAIGPREYELFEALCALLDIRFREVVREEMSGSYGVDVRGLLTGYPSPTFEITIEFGCEPGREEVLTAAVLEQIRKLQAEPASESYITKLRESVRRSREEGLKNNGYWVHQIIGSTVRGRPLEEITDTNDVLKRITAETMQQYARTYLNTDNYVKAYLMPAQ